MLCCFHFQDPDTFHPQNAFSRKPCFLDSHHYFDYHGRSIFMEKASNGFLPRIQEYARKMITFFTLFLIACLLDALLSLLYLRKFYSLTIKLVRVYCFIKAYSVLGGLQNVSENLQVWIFYNGFHKQKPSNHLRASFS